MNRYLAIVPFLLWLATAAVAATCNSYCYVDSLGNTNCITSCTDD